ncbi:MAG: MFS transporter [Holosporaceae bacterium]|nr:MFS transporter [Holosporaceae bacterium]
MNLKKSVVIVSFGTLLEWAEFTFFAYMADYLSRLFFPISDVTFSRLKIYGVFAASYIMRPIGAIIFGHIGDKHGRKIPMIISLLLMALATCGIGILPTYDFIGDVSSFLLIVFRMLQGIAVGGEFNGATVLLTEYDKQRPFLAGSWTSFAASAGMALGSVASLAASGNFAYTILGQILYGVLDALVSATAFTILLRQFKTGANSGSSLAWSISTAIFGGTTLMMNEFLVGQGLLVGHGLYMSLSALICLITVGYVCKK